MSTGKQPVGPDDNSASGQERGAAEKVKPNASTEQDVPCPTLEGRAIAEQIEHAQVVGGDHRQYEREGATEAQSSQEDIKCQVGQPERE